MIVSAVRRSARLFAGLGGVVLLLAACTGGSAEDPPEGGPPTTLPVPTSSATSEQASDPAFARFYEQQPAWEPCGERVECSTVTVPVDWDSPDGETLELAVVRRPADGQRTGSLLMNPGGPGASGVDYVADYGESSTTRTLREAYDLVGFDPRGVGESEPVDCLDDAEMDAYLAMDVDPTTPEGIEQMRAEAEEFAAGCAQDAGELLANVDTVSAARDMDVLRAVLGDERLNYLGKSYGTLLGAVYAELFPQRVGRLVLDGALDPTLSYAEVGIGQARGMEQALRAYVEDCPARETCPLRGDVEDGLEQVRSVIRTAEERPLRTEDAGRPLTSSLAFYGLVAPLYDDASWPVLDEALEQAFVGDGSGLLRIADIYSDRQPDGSYASNLLEAFNAVNCLDYPVDASPETMAQVAQQLQEASPTFGEALAYGEVLCDAWPVEPVGLPESLDAEGAPPVLVVGTTGDPATPYEWSVALAEQLDGARLLTWDGEGHTAYMRGSACVDAAVDAYLVDGVLPGDGATC
ncbi:MAG: alpha/beta hydrolase [Actinomycetota bacterium]